MEMMRRIYKTGWRSWWLCVLLLVVASLQLAAQPKVKEYIFKDGKMYISLGKQLSTAEIDEFIKHYDLADLDLKSFIKTAKPDSLQKLGWEIVLNTSKLFTISKPLYASDEGNEIGNKIIWSEDILRNMGARFPVVSNQVIFGYNSFRNKSPFALSDESVSFFLRNNLDAGTVQLAGSFTSWQLHPVTMKKTDSGWTVNVNLKPGKYWYKFIADGNWMTDNDNLLRENDGEGNINSVYFRPNVNFTIDGRTDAKKIFLAGSFNNWDPKQLLMHKTANGWELPLYLAEGTHTYKFVIDGKWFALENIDVLPDGNSGFNSVIRIGKPHVFKLNGYGNAKQVALSGSFNGWKDNELYLTKTSAGWELPYVIGPGNYEYKFVVDGAWITDPANDLTVNNGNSYLIISPNYTFRIKGFHDAKAVHLAGDFNNWNPAAFPMRKRGDEWVFDVHLSPGKHLYKFVIDGQWLRDPDNKLWEQNEYDNGNSILWIEE